MDDKTIKWLLSDRPVACSKCDASLYYKGGGRYVCSECGHEEYDDFGKVKKFLDANGPTPSNIISEVTGVSMDKLDAMLRNGQVEIPEGSKFYIKCEGCGCSIRYGRFCPDCVRKTVNGLQQAFLVTNMGEKPKAPGAMRFYGKDEKPEKKLQGTFHGNRGGNKSKEKK